MKNVLGRQLGATLVESVTEGWVDDPEIGNMSPTFDGRSRRFCRCSTRRCCSG